MIKKNITKRTEEFREQSTVIDNYLLGLFRGDPKSHLQMAGTQNTVRKITLAATLIIF